MTVEPPTQTQVLFCGDPHNRFEQINRSAREMRPAAMILLGDYDLERPLHEELAEARRHTQILWIAGNHDFDNDAHYDNLFEHNELLEGNLHCRIVEISGLRIAGLSGIFLGRVWYPQLSMEPPKFESRAAFERTMGRGNRWRGGLPRRVRQAIWFEDYMWLREQKADVLVTHQAPRRSHRHGFAAIDALAEALGARLIVHGHHHHCYRDDSSSISVMGVGLGGISDLNGHIIELGLTESRSEK